MKNKIICILLFLPIFAMASMMAYYMVHGNFQKVRVAVNGYDPRDLLSGFYMQLTPDWQRTDCTQFTENICPQKEFESVYNYYINRSHSDKLSQAVNEKRAELLFSYKQGQTPQIVDLLIDGRPKKEFIGE